MDARQSTRIKVTLTYLGIIMLMSLTFSSVIYGVSRDELARQRNIPIPNAISNFLSYDEFEALRAHSLSQSQANLRNKLVLFNLFTLIIGAIVSYLLARQSLRPIEEAYERQNSFTSDASHELRTPLTVMKTEIEVSLRDKNLTINDARNALTSNLEEIIKLEALTGGLLQLARQENSDITKQKVDINQLIDDCVSLVTPLAEPKKIKIIKSGASKQTVLAEPNSLRQSIVILLDNAIKYSPNKSSININYKNTRTHHQLKISDNGSGISAQDLPHIFDRFYRADQSRTKTETSGYGLGLSIAKQIIKAHGGQIDIKSAVGKGTEATIILPKK